MRILVLGAGGIGGYFGGRLAQAGIDVTFLVRDARARRLAADGLVIASPLGDAKVPVRTMTRDTLAGAYDLVVLSCKAYDLADAIEAVRPAVGPATLVLPLLNGVAHLDRLDAAFGPAAVLGGLAHISVTLGGDGHVRHLLKLDTLTYGARFDPQRPACEALSAVLGAGGFTLRRSDAVVQEMWEKFAFITAAAGITCLMRGSVGDILRAAEGERLTLAMVGECEAVAAAAGFAIRDRARGFARTFLTEAGSSFTSSMLRDVETGGRVEADHLQGDMIRRAEALGIAVPLLRVAYCQLQAYAGRMSPAP